MGANDIAAKDLEAFPDVAADLLNVLLHDGSRHIREQYEGKAHGTCPVLELVLYWGKRRWSSPRSMKRMFRKKGLPETTWKYIDDMRLHVWEMRYLPKEIRERFTSDMRIVVDYLAEGNSYRSDRKIVHKEALINMLRSLSGDVDFEETKMFMKEMNIREGDELMACELFDQYIRKGKAEGRQEGLLSAAQNCMKELNLTVEEALKAVGIPKAEWEQYEKKLG